MRPLLASDVQALVPRLRSSDVEEMRLLQRMDPEDSLNLWLSVATTTRSVHIDERVEGIFAVAPLSGGMGQWWFVGSDELMRHWRWFARASREWLPRLQRGYRAIGNIVKPEATVKRRWLAWLGADFLRPVEIAGRPYIPYLLWSHDDAK